MVSLQSSKENPLVCMVHLFGSAYANAEKKLKPTSVICVADILQVVGVLHSGTNQHTDSRGQKSTPLGKTLFSGVPILIIPNTSTGVDEASPLQMNTVTLQPSTEIWEGLSRSIVLNTADGTLLLTGLTTTRVMKGAI